MSRSVKDISAPPPGAIDWVVRNRSDGREARATAQTAYAAHLQAGVGAFSEVDCIPLGEDDEDAVLDDIFSIEVRESDQHWVDIGGEAGEA